MGWYRELGLAVQLFDDRFDDVVGHERLTVVLSDVAIRHEAGFAAQVSRKLTAIVVLHNEGVPSIFEDLKDCFTVEGNQPADLKLIG